jgi:hypothetical protein
LTWHGAFFVFPLRFDNGRTGCTALTTGLHSEWIIWRGATESSRNISSCNADVLRQRSGGCGFVGVNFGLSPVQGSMLASDKITSVIFRHVVVVGVG